MAVLLCPRRDCTGATRVLKTHGPKDPQLPPDLKGLNVVHRRHECAMCHTRFGTVEMEELEFGQLRKPKTLEQPQPSVRPRRRP